MSDALACTVEFQMGDVAQLVKMLIMKGVEGVGRVVPCIELDHLRQKERPVKRRIG